MRPHRQRLTEHLSLLSLSRWANSQRTGQSMVGSVVTDSLIQWSRNGLRDELFKGPFLEIHTAAQLLW